MLDVDSNAWALSGAESGGKPWGDPIPAGRYSILERRGRAGFYRLERNDSHFGDDETPEGRTNLRLHGPGRTVGCIEVCRPRGFANVDKLLKQTSRSAAQVDSKSILGRLMGSKESLTNFGTLDVLPTGYSLNYNAKTGVVSVTHTETGSLIPKSTKVCTVQKDGHCK